MNTAQMEQALWSVLRGAAGAERWAMFTAEQWQHLALLAQTNGVVPLLVAHWERTGWPQQMPAAIRQQINYARYANTAHALLLQTELRRVLGALQEVSPVVVLKGAALGPTLYNDPALRPCSDIDLLVPTNRRDAVVHALRQLGYHDVPELAPGINAAAEYHVQLRGGGHAVTIEVHWNLVAGTNDWRAPDLAWFWEQTEPWPLGALPPAAPASLYPVLQLTPTAHLLYLAAHLMLQHGGAALRMIWVYDLHLLAMHGAQQIDWPLLVKQAQQFRWTAALVAALRVAQQHLHTGVPPEIFELEDSAGAYERAFVTQKARAPFSMNVNEWFKLWAMAPRQRLRFVWRVCVPAWEYVRWRYKPQHAWLMPLCYLRHWLRLVGAAADLVRTFATARRKRSA